MFTHPVGNPKLGFVLSGSWLTLEKLWPDALPDTTNDLYGIPSHDPLTESRKCYPLIGNSL